MSSKICKAHRDHEEVAHYVMSEFLEHPRAEELVHEGRAMNFLSGMIHRSFHSSTSRYHKIYRQAGRVYPYDKLFRWISSNDGSHGDDTDKKIHSGAPNGYKTLSQKMYDNLDRDNADYDHEQDYVVEAISGILEEMKISGNKDLWYMAVLFSLYMETSNYSELERKTRIPRTSISQAVSECKEYIKEELKNRNIGYDI